MIDSNSNKHYSIDSLAKLKEFASLIAQELCAGESYALDGPLGAGKTTFMKELVEALGGEAKQVSSPTYVLQNEYSLPGNLRIEHWDLYRVKELPIELTEPAEKNVIRMVEWASNFPPFLESCRGKIQIAFCDSTHKQTDLARLSESREITVTFSFIF